MTDVYIRPVPIALGGDVMKPALIQRPPPTRAEIAVWEGENGRLPDDYIAFMMAHNGGTVYPASFRHNITNAPDWRDLAPTATIDKFFTWDVFVKSNSFHKVDWRVDHVVIAYANERGYVILSQRKQDSGAVRYWPANVADWDEYTEGPLPVATLAPTFRQFIFDALFAQQEDGTPRWSIPRDLATAAKVRF